MKIVGFAGTAKNTGKTTAALHVLQAGKAAGLRLALTSIGYDGENRDNITGLPKPKYVLQKGMLVATSASCLKAGSATIQIINETPIQTVFGQIIVGEVTRPGTVLLAGPNRSEDVVKIIEYFIDLGCDLTLVDGALNRLAPMTCTNGLVLSTGAAYEQNIPCLVQHSKALLDLLQMRVEDGLISSENHIEIFFRNFPPLVLCQGSLIGERSFHLLVEKIEYPVSSIYIPGACSPRLLASLIHSRTEYLEGAQVVFGNSLRLVTGGNPVQWENTLKIVEGAGIMLSCQKCPPVYFMTFNPFFPRYHKRTGSYEAAYVDKHELIAAARAQITTTPVLDIFQPPIPDVISLINHFGE